MIFGDDLGCQIDEKASASCGFSGVVVFVVDWGCYGLLRGQAWRAGVVSEKLRTARPPGRSSRR